MISSRISFITTSLISFPWAHYQFFLYSFIRRQHIIAYVITLFRPEWQKDKGDCANEKWKFKASFPNWWWAIDFEKHLKSSEYSLFSSALLFSVPPEIFQFSGRETPFSSNLRHHPSLLSLLPQWVGWNKKINSRFFFCVGILQYLLFAFLRSLEISLHHIFSLIIFWI